MLRPAPNVVARDMGGSAVLIHLDTNRIFELNASGARVWALLTDGFDRRQICDRLQEEFPGTDTIEQTVDELLHALRGEGLIGG